MTDLINLRHFDTLTETRVIGGREHVTIPYAAVLAMSPDELNELLPNGRRVVADGIRAGALAQIAADAERESA